MEDQITERDEYEHERKSHEGIQVRKMNTHFRPGFCLEFLKLLVKLCIERITDRHLDHDLN